MIERIQQSRLGRIPGRLYKWLQHEMAPALLRRRIIGAALIASLLAAVYWLLIASDRYVSEARVIVQRADLAGVQGADLSGLLNGLAGGGASRADMLLLRDHLRSVDMLKKLDAALNLRAHYSDASRDLLSRMWFADAPMEWFHRHYLSRVSIELDDYAGVLTIRTEAYDPKTAQAIADMLVREGERFINEMAHEIARDQVVFLERQVADINTKARKAQQALIAFQNREGLISPQATAEGYTALIARLEAQRADLEAQKRALLAYLVPDHPSVVQLDQQIAAVERQIAQERAKLAAPTGKPLTRALEEYQRLELEAAFAQDMYKTALAALERGRVEATRTIKKVSVLQTPTLPEYPLEPRRWYNTLVFFLVAMLLAGVVHLVAAIVRDHTD